MTVISPIKQDASLIAQLVKNLPAMQATWVQSLGWEDLLEEGTATWRRERLPTPVFWPGEFHGLYSSWGPKSWTRLSDFHSHIKQDLGKCPFLHDLFRDAFYTSMEIVIFFLFELVTC